MTMATLGCTDRWACALRRLACAMAATVMLALAASAWTPARAQSSATDKRIALVIGNARYPAIPLNNPENDARVVGRTLRGLGFEVIEHVNLPVKKFRQVLREYVRRLQTENGIGLLYYAGHGVQIDGRNYLLPVDINLRDQEEIKDEAVDIDDLFVSKLDRASSRGLIVILDACRDNPFSTRTRNIQASGGLAEMGARGAMIAYSAAPGAAAEDGPEGTNSVFTRHLVREMLEPGVEVETMFKNVRVKVLQDTRKRQMPWVNSSLTIDFQFNPQQVATRAELAKQDEIKALQERLERLEREQREKEAQMQAMERQLEHSNARDTLAKPPPPTVGTEPIAPPVASVTRPLEKPLPAPELARPKEHEAAREPPRDARKPVTQLARSEPAPIKRSESERCVALQIRAQLGEPVSVNDLQKECRK